VDRNAISNVPRIGAEIFESSTSSQEAGTLRVYQIPEYFLRPLTSATSVSATPQELNKHVNTLLKRIIVRIFIEKYVKYTLL
jgi:hypothetical protein